MAKNMFIKALLIPAITIAQVALGAISEPDRATMVTRNAIQNPGAENGKSGWAVSTGSFIASNSTPIAGNASFVWDAGASNETLSVAFTVPEWLKGQNAVASCQVRCATGTCTHVLEPLVASVVQGTTSITSSTTASPRVTANFIAPTSGAMGLQLRSTANEPSLKVDSCIIARADEYNLFQVSQATLYGTLKYATTTNCLWSVSSAAAFTSFAADTDCPTATVTGGVSAPTTKVPGVRLQNLPPGNYAFHVTNFFQKQNAASEEYALRFFDGTNGFSPQGAIAASDAGQTSLYGFVSYTAAQSDITVQLQAIRNGTNALSIRGDTRDFEISVYRFPTSSETAARVDSLPASWSGYHDNTCSFTNSSTGSFGDFSGDASCNLVQTNNINFGTVTSYLNGGNPSSGIVITPSKPGAFLVTATTSAANSSGAQVASIALTDGNNTILSAQSFRVINTGYEHTFALSGIVYATSLSAVTAKLRGKVTGGTTTIDVDATQRVSWSVVALSQSFPAPLLVGSVTSASAGLIRTEHAVIGTTNDTTGCNTGTCTVFNASSNWISATRSGTGTYTYTISGFSGKPVCVCKHNRLASLNIACRVDSATTVSAYTANNADTAQDEPVSIHCQGPR